ncbi:MAG: Protein-glutamine gamma-glutamyltransferase [Pseudomonadota bacterium]|jgi:transglutaminase-like putative cysteine protease
MTAARPPRRYRVHHRTEYHYSGAVAHSHQLLRLRPRPLPHQVTLHHEVSVDPVPARSSEDHDAFGNPVTRLQIERPSDHLVVESRLEVEVRPRPEWRAQDSEPWDVMVRRLAYSGETLDDEALEIRRYRCESPFVRIKREFGSYAAGCFPRGCPVLAGAEALMRSIHADFQYAPGETQVGTPLLDVLRSRRGVCQDLAHVMVACLRALGLSARYVSGYLRTIPLAGATVPDLVGADASHAWVAVHAPPFGWVPLDPTNNLRVGLDHVTVAWGRDFGDVSPLRGVLLGGGGHRPRVNVSVQPLTEETR